MRLVDIVREKQVIQNLPVAETGNHLQWIRLTEKCGFVLATPSKFPHSERFDCTNLWNVVLLPKLLQFQKKGVTGWSLSTLMLNVCQFNKEKVLWELM